MKKFQLSIAAALLFASSAYAQTGQPQGFRSVADCIGCAEITIAPAAAQLNNPNGNYTVSTAIDNCSEVVQGGTGVNTGNNNVAVVDQQGHNNRARLLQREGNVNYGRQDQMGNGNQAHANTYGSNNTSLQLQRGQNNRAGINVDQVVGQHTPGETQNGNRNWAQQRQVGAGGINTEGTANIANINQYGNTNLASQDQMGNNNSANILQRVHQSTAVQEQMGNANIAVTLQGTSNNVTATESFQRSSVQQGGNGNSAYVAQNRQ